jgi:diaminopimelate epimerase
MIPFTKYSSTGNDFILIDNRESLVSGNLSEKAKKLCARRTGIGADGLVLLENHSEYDFEMKIINADGSTAEMCGNATRAIIHFAHNELKLKKENHYTFKTLNSTYNGVVSDKEMKVQMTELSDIREVSDDFEDYKTALYLDTGVPHLVLEVEELEDFPVYNTGKEYRHFEKFEKGANVDFFEVVDKDKQWISLRTYERGVEDETLSCGTGVTATAIACHKNWGWTGTINCMTHGGLLKVELNDDLSKVYFSGPVDLVYKGSFSE